MAQTSYSYSISGDFPNQKVDAGALHEQIQSSTIVTALDGVSTQGDNCDVTFKDVLSGGDKAILDGLIAIHDGQPLPDPTTEDGKPIFHLDAPSDGPDKKPVFVSSPAPEGWLTFFTGRGDEANPTPPASGRGTGQQIKIEFTTGESYPIEKSAEWQYAEPTYVHDGQLTWKSPDEFDGDDYFSLAIKIPANTPVVNNSNTGNCNVVPSGLGYSIIIPATGNGTHDIDLVTAIPAPAGLDNTGYWEVNERTGEVTISHTPGNAPWHLLDVEIHSYFIRCLPMSHPMGVYDVDVYKTEWVSERWSWVLTVSKQAQPMADAMVAGWLMVFRESAT